MEIWLEIKVPVVFTFYNFVQIRHLLDCFVRDVAVMFFQNGVDLIVKDLLYVRV